MLELGESDEVSGALNPCPAEVETNQVDYLLEPDACDLSVST